MTEARASEGSSSLSCYVPQLRNRHYILQDDERRKNNPNKALIMIFFLQLHMRLPWVSHINF